MTAPAGLILEHDPERQARIVKALAHGRAENRAADELLKLCRSRTLPGPIMLPPGRDLRGEAREELADFVNYVPWGVFAGEIRGDRASKACAHAWAAFALLR